MVLISTTVKQTSAFTLKENWTTLTYTKATNRGLIYSTASELLNPKSTRKKTGLHLLILRQQTEG